MDIHGLLLYAGRATRLGPLARRGKATLRVSNRPVLIHHLVLLARAGVTATNVVVRPEHEEEVRALAETAERSLGCRVTVLTQAAAAGPGAALGHALPHLPADVPVILILGDTLLKGLPPLTDTSWIGSAPAPHRRHWCTVETGPDNGIRRCVERVAGPGDGAEVAIGAYYFSDGKVLRATAETVLADYRRRTDPPELQLSELLNLYRETRPMRARRLPSWLDVGDWESAATTALAVHETRSFNKIEGSARGVIRKTGSDDGFMAEATYIRDLDARRATLFPRISGVAADRSSYDLEYLAYPTLAELLLYEGCSADWWVAVARRIFDTITTSLWALGPDDDVRRDHAVRDAHEIITGKMATRYQRLLPLEPLAAADTVTINGVPLRAGAALVAELTAALSDATERPVVGYAHGDLCMSNVLLSVESGIFRLIDPRGVERNGTGFHALADVRYDVAKFRHSYHGMYEAFVHGLFRIDDRGGDGFGLRFAQPVDVTGALDRFFLGIGFVPADIALIEAAQFISLCPLHADDPQRLRGLYLRAVQVANEALDRGDAVSGTAGHPVRNLWRLRAYLRPYRSQLVLMVITAALAIGATIVVPLVIAAVIDGPVRHRDTAGLLWLGLAVVGLGLAEAFMVWVRRFTQSYAVLSLESDLRDDLYTHLQRLPLAFHDGAAPGQLLSRITSDVGVIRRFLSFGVIYLIVNVCQFTVVVALLVHMYWPLGLLVALAAVPLFLISRRFARRFLVVSRQVQDARGDLATLIDESAHGIRVIKAYGRHRHMAALFGDAAEDVRRHSLRRARLDSRFAPLYELVPNVALAVIVVFGAVAVAQGRLSVAELVAFATLQAGLVWPVQSMGWILSSGQEAMTAADRIYDVFDTEATLLDRPGAIRVTAPEVTGLVRFEGVSFHHPLTATGRPGAPRPVLTGIDLEIRPGETMALVGATGSGKSTLTALVPRLYDVTGGRITLDGRDVRDYQLDSLRQVVATAFEEPILFSMSVRENLALGRRDATDSDLAEALRVAQAEFVHDLPAGLDTRVGERGLSLSGGQRQRIALARAVVSRPAVLVLDDPLSALDVHTEALVEAALSRVLAGATALLVVHRPSTVALADRVALLADGRIAAVGTHSELLATVPAYRAVLSAAAESDDELNRLPQPEGSGRR